MLQLQKDILIYSDVNYTHAVNYQHLYNAPITLNYGDKHNRKKYILSAGNSDNIELWQEGIFIYVLAQNNGLQYISLQIINTETSEIESDIFLGDEDCNNESCFSFGILDKDSEDQIKTLLEYS